jgi:hypothetical protein
LKWVEESCITDGGIVLDISSPFDVITSLTVKYASTLSYFLIPNSCLVSRMENFLEAGDATLLGRVA